MDRPCDMDVTLLAFIATGMTHERAEQALDEDVDVDARLCANYQVDFEQYSKIIGDLIKFTNPWKSPLGKRMYQGFVDHCEGLAILKVEVKTDA